MSSLLVAVIYTGSKSLVSSLKFVSLALADVHSNSSVFPSTREPHAASRRAELTTSIFKNLTIILIAYGEVVMFNGMVTGLTLCAFGLMVSFCHCLQSC